MFCKLFNTKHGQFLLRKIEDDNDGSYGLEVSFDTKSPMAGTTAIITKKVNFGSSETGEENRDRMFSKFEQSDADADAEAEAGI